MNVKLIKMILVLLLLTSLAACSPQPNTWQAIQQTRTESNSSPQISIAVQEPDISVDQFLQQMPLIKEERRAGILRAWRKIPHYDQYRKARASDFKNPDWTEKEYDRSYDYVSLLILIERPANRYDAYWIYRDKDLSSVSLNRHSGNIYLAGTGDEGVNLNCDIKWDKSERRWTCKGP